METRYFTNRVRIEGYPNISVESFRDEPTRMVVGGERQRAYRYGMTLLCAGALFSWVGTNDPVVADPIRFIGYTCIASGALLICMAICFWASSGRSVHSRHSSQVRPVQRGDMSVSILDRGRLHREKPPDYDTVADLSPPPSYDDAIRLSPAYLIPATTSGASCTEERAPEYSVTCTVINEVSPSNEIQPPQRTTTVEPALEESRTESTTNSISNSTNPDIKPDDESDSPLSRVLRLSSRFLRRTLSNVDSRRAGEEEAPPIRRTNSFQDMKNT